MTQDAHAAHDAQLAEALHRISLLEAECDRQSRMAALVEKLIPAAEALRLAHADLRTRHAEAIQELAALRTHCARQNRTLWWLNSEVHRLQRPSRMFRARRYCARVIRKLRARLAAMGFGALRAASTQHTAMGFGSKSETHTHTSPHHEGQPT